MMRQQHQSMDMPNQTIPRAMCRMFQGSGADDTGVKFF